MTIHFLHIGKTGGNALREALASLIAEGRVTWRRHAVGLADIPAGEPVAFFVRHPVSRFVSGFNSRLRKGRPRRNAEWSDGEQWSFERFRTPDELARALASADPGVREDAARALRSISHLSRRLTDFLGGPAEVEARSDDILFVGFQETLEHDLRVLERIIGAPAPLSLPGDPVLSHRTPPGFETDLSEAGRAAIEAWFAADLALYDWLEGFSVRRGWRSTSG